VIPWRVMRPARSEALLLVVVLPALLVRCGARTAIEGRPDGGQNGCHPGAHIVPMGGFFCDLPGDTPAGMKLADGLCARKFADVRTPRAMAFAPNGDLFVSSPSAPTPGGAPPGIGGIFVIPDDDRDGIADTVCVYLQGPDLATVHGLAFRNDGELAYTLDHAVMSTRYAYGDRIGQRVSQEMIAELRVQTGIDRWTHGLAVGSDSTIYVSRGVYDSSDCSGRNLRSGSVLRVGGGHDLQGDLAIGGMRNPLYIRCAPWGSCYAAELSGRSWTSIGGHDKLIEIKDGDDYGYPCCVDRDKPVPGLNPAADCSAIASSIDEYHLHDTSFGFDWDARGLWPAPYTGALFMAFHGSFFEGPWLGTPRLGHDRSEHASTDCRDDVARIRLRNQRPDQRARDRCAHGA
jgi:glucose/arabinose dehydrogenase